MTIPVSTYSAFRKSDYSEELERKVPSTLRYSKGRFEYVSSPNVASVGIGKIPP